MRTQHAHGSNGPNGGTEEPPGPDRRCSRRALLGGAASGVGLAASGLLLPDWLVAETEAATSKQKKRQRRQRRRRRRRQPQGTPGLAVDLYVENRLGREISVSTRSTNTNWGNQDIDHFSLRNGEHYDYYGHHEADDAKTESRLELFVEGPSTPVWLMVENPSLWPMNVSVMQGGWFRYDPRTERYDSHADYWLVERQWLLVGGSLVTTVTDAHVRVTYERKPDTATHMVVHAWLDPA